jgi:multiple sugar transport system permease protein
MAVTGAARPADAGTATAVVASAPVTGPSGRWRRRIAYVLLIGYAILMFIPFAWSVVTSFKTLPDSVKMSFIPDPFTLQAWEYAWNEMQPPLPQLFLNSTVIAIAVTLTNLVLGSVAGYAFARLRFPGRELLFLIVLATLMIPDQLRLVPVYLIMNTLGLTRGLGQYAAVVIVLAISGTTIFLMRQFFLAMPRELEEAARIDGAGFFTTFWRVMLPLAGPALAAVTILQFQGTWNGFFWPVVFLANPDHYTLPIGLYFFRTAGGFANDWPPLMAVVVMATIPIVVIYIFFQRYFVEGIASTGVKG